MYRIGQNGDVTATVMGKATREGECDADGEGDGDREREKESERDTERNGERGLRAGSFALRILIRGDRAYRIGMISTMSSCTLV